MCACVLRRRALRSGRDAPAGDRGRGAGEGARLQPGIDLLEKDPKLPKDAPLLVITDGDCNKLTLYGRGYAYLIPYGSRLPFIPKGKVFRLR